MSDTYALVDTDGNVLNVIVATADYITELASLVADPTVDTGVLPEGVRGYKVNGLVDSEGRAVGMDHRRAGNGRWVLKEALVRPRPVPEEARP